jgi:hypothetical protein
LHKVGQRIAKVLKPEVGSLPELVEVMQSKQGPESRNGAKSVSDALERTVDVKIWRPREEPGKQALREKRSKEVAETLLAKKLNFDSLVDGASPRRGLYRLISQT